MAAKRRMSDILRKAREAKGQSLRGAARELGIDRVIPVAGRVR